MAGGSDGWSPAGVQLIIAIAARSTVTDSVVIAV
jgi:hypothetical protein